MIELRNLTKRFGKTVAVDDLSLVIGKGEFFTIIGPNGAGKTTTLKLVAGLLKPTGGRVFVGGFDMAGQSDRAKSIMSYIPDIPYVYEKLTGREFLYFTGELYRLDPRRYRADTEELLELFLMKDQANQLLESYSHGMRQKIVISSALLSDPRIIIIDEPMVGLDPRSIRLVKDILRKRALGGTTVFMSTHTLSLAEEISDRLGIIHQGKFVALGNAGDIKKAAVDSEGLEDVFLKMTAED
ncbi:MAG: ABC transporter ATP-binding protein [Syntrophales bacterium]|jgi:ABC-2 type transport system ATP-binding protein|nr:ABC transporter ATP-binding protein [Syntrophales bacterium]MCK9527347.1 ABC transporter ATP-binding protein [Syntrophales bacterium]MDX9921183.1 ABC transporter ATP-binding protein [Syntrophales bacterium]